MALRSGRNLLVLGGVAGVTHVLTGCRGCESPVEEVAGSIRACLYAHHPGLLCSNHASHSLVLWRLMRKKKVLRGYRKVSCIEQLRDVCDSCDIHVTASGALMLNGQHCHASQHPKVSPRYNCLRTCPSLSF